MILRIPRFHFTAAVKMSNSLMYSTTFTNLIKLITFFKPHKVDDKSNPSVTFLAPLCDFPPVTGTVSVDVVIKC